MANQMVSNWLLEKHGAMLTAEQAAGVLSIEVEDVEMMLQAGELLGKQLGNKTRISIHEIEKILSGIIENAIDTPVSSALQSASLIFEEYIVSEEEFEMGKAQNGSVYFCNTRNKWKAAYYVEESGLKKRKIISGISESDVRNAMYQAMAAAGIPLPVLAVPMASVAPAAMAPIQYNPVMTAQLQAKKHLLVEFMDNKALPLMKTKGENATRAHYENMAKHIRKRFEGVYIEDVDTLTAARFIDELTWLKNPGKALSDKAKKEVYIVLNFVLRRAVKDKLIQENPMTDEGLCPKIKKHRNQRTKNYIVKEDLVTLLDTIKDNQTVLDLIVILLVTGMRISELLGLSHANVNHEKLYIDVKETKKRVYKSETREGREDPMIGKPKTDAGIRIVPINSLVSEIIQRRQLENPTSKRVFENAVGKPLDYSNLRDYVVEYLEGKKLGYIKFQFHRLRKSYATYMGDIGANTADLAVLMGHENENITDDVYRAITEKRMYELTDNYFRYMEDVLKIVQKQD
jgi:integrase